MDTQSKLFETALEIKEPLYIKNIAFDERLVNLVSMLTFGEKANSLGLFAPDLNQSKICQNHYAGILQFFKSKLTAEFSEGINSRIQKIKRRSKGFHNIDYFISMIYLETYKLPLSSYPSYL